MFSCDLFQHWFLCNLIQVCPNPFARWRRCILCICHPFFAAVMFLYWTVAFLLDLNWDWVVVICGCVVTRNWKEVGASSWGKGSIVRYGFGSNSSSAIVFTSGSVHVVFIRLFSSSAVSGSMDIGGYCRRYCMELNSDSELKDLVAPKIGRLTVAVSYRAIFVDNGIRDMMTLVVALVTLSDCSSSGSTGMATVCLSRKEGARISCGKCNWRRVCKWEILTCVRLGFWRHWCIFFFVGISPHHVLTVNTNGRNEVIFHI